MQVGRDVIVSCEFVGCFFFQAEDGIRDLTVTGVQTCALPISANQRKGRAALRCCVRRSHPARNRGSSVTSRSEEHTSELQSQSNLVCRLLLEKKKTTTSRADHKAQYLTVCLRSYATEQRLYET